jgi:hypothetical protein
LAGAPVSSTINSKKLNSTDNVTYKWETTGGTIIGTGETVLVDTTGMAAGSYTIRTTATDKNQKKNNLATCNATFSIRQPRAPTAR